MQLLIATGNAHKVQELSQLLGHQGVRVVVPDEVGGLPEVIEDRDSFEGNAAKKAQSAARHARQWSLADDSGLAVEALGGAPGVSSARYAGDHASDADNNARLLRELADVPEERRGASFHCVLALANPAGELVAHFHGQARGRILFAGRGQHGFGYDPLFQFDEPQEPGHGRTFAELSSAEKACVSHRARALAQLARELPDLLHATR